jgi:hypothetical protein
MAMRQHDGLDRTEIGGEPSHVALEGVFLRPGVEQQAVAL